MTKEELLWKLWSNTEIKDNHWLWIGGKTRFGEHGVYKFNGINRAVSRLSCYIYLDLDLDNINDIACHKLECKYKNCWNPDHLYNGTFGENLKDSYKLGRTNGWSDRTHCKNGHEFNKLNTSKYRGYRVCKVCEREKQAKRYKKHKEFLIELRAKFKK